MIYATLIAWGLAMTGWGIYWRSQAEDLVDENFTLRFGASPVAGAEGEPAAVTGVVCTPAPVTVTPTGGDGGMDDLLLELLATPRIPQQRPGGAS